MELCTFWVVLTAVLIFKIPGPAVACLQEFSACDKRSMIQAIRKNVLHKSLLTSEALNNVSDFSLRAFDRGRVIQDEEYKNSILQIIYEKKVVLDRSIVIHTPCRWICSSLRLLRDVTFDFVLLTFGRDDKGSPVHGCDKQDRIFREGNVRCFQRMLGLKHNVLYFVSQHKSAFTHPKLRLLPIGFGELHCRTAYGIPEQLLRQEYEHSFHHLDAVCEQEVASTFNKIFVNHGLGSGSHSRIRSESILSMNSLGANGTVYGKFQRSRLLMLAATSTIGSSPRGTGADCHRHMELLMSGLVVFANLDEANASKNMYSDLPITFIPSWRNLTCAAVTDVVRHAYSSQHNFSYQKLTAEYWQTYIFNEVCKLTPGSLHHCIASFEQVQMRKCL